MDNLTLTLFKEEKATGNEYFEQIVLEFDEAKYISTGYHIESYPQQEDEDLQVKLFYEEIETGSDEIIYDFSIGNFPNNISNWNLKIFCDLSEGNSTSTEHLQGEEEAEPRPIHEV